MSAAKRTPQRRGQRVAPPPSKDEWDVVFATSDAAEGWELLGRHAPGPTSECWRVLRTNPLRRDKRQKQLAGRLSHRSVGDRNLEHWQYEVTGAGRVWYCPDPQRRVVWMTGAFVGHPKATD